MQRAILGIIASAFLVGCTDTSLSTSGGGSTRSQTQVVSYEDAVNAFIEACVKTAASPNSAPQAFEALGFGKKENRNGGYDFQSPYATAQVSLRAGVGKTTELGQCQVIPNGGNFQTSAALLSQQISKPSFRAKRVPGNTSWFLGNTGTIAIVSFNKGMMVRTQRLASSQ
ncbi:hypothetical protein KQ247_10380 [Ruegeria pomeroyi]|uniref:Lipoprotein n=1 Tax=Ruegeria pomeroyi (strain ATCC 700808 / DSM 15171 / DSS-3) TaxID=246200 RepID=V5UYD5_RUEPO|nr:hypothetical protein [Ruegeria pomeroyi]AHB86006.1 hypothetical protein SPO0346a [Ruegeria pomeroyi DSS-3]NVL02250.1 hypothetical protein [Ruegeria pomeroyi]QWV07254.1 hypothetical protein KQ247_10380 [Ruegeria pomeroyi]